MSDDELEFIAHMTAAQKALGLKSSIRVALEDEGIKHDSEKLPLHLFPWDTIFPIAEVLAFGAKKYGDRNWEKGMDWDRLHRAAMGHMIDWFQQIDKGKGPGMDQETGLNSLHHAACCIVFLIAYSERGIGNDNRPNGDR